MMAGQQTHDYRQRIVKIAAMRKVFDDATVNVHSQLKLLEHYRDSILSLLKELENELAPTGDDRP